VVGVKGVTRATPAGFRACAPQNAHNAPAAGPYLCGGLGPFAPSICRDASHGETF
jgi:hypothetical protein